MKRCAFNSSKPIGQTVERVALQLGPRTDISDAAFITNHNDFGAAFDGAAVVTASSGAAPGSSLREENFADTAVAADAVADLGEYTGHLRVLRVQDAFAREQHLEEKRPEQRRAEDSACNRQEQDQRCDKDTVAMQEVAGSAKPAEERGEGEAIEGGEALGTAGMRAAAMRTCAMRACAVVGEPRVADMKVPQMKVREAAKKEGHTEDETDAEADEVEGFHSHWVRRFVRLFAVTGLG